MKTLKNFLYLFLFFLSVNVYSQNGAPTCDSSEPMCSDNNGVKIFPNVTGVPSTASYGCLQDSPNPAWFYIKVDQTGELKFNIVQNTSFDSNGNPTGAEIDVDFIAWGPFRSSDNNCTNIATTCNTGACPNNTDNPNYYINDNDGTNIIDCSWSGQAQESFTIPNAQAGEFYILLVTNWTAAQPGTKGFIKLEQTNFGVAGAGVTDCSIIAGDLGADQEVCFGTNVQLDGTPTTTTDPIDTYEWQVDVNDGNGFTTIAGQTNAILDITNNVSGIYKVIVTDINGVTGQDEVEITFFDVPTANQPNNINFCDVDRDGFNEFNLETEFTSQVLNGQSNTEFEVLYFSSMLAANANAPGTALPNLYTNAVAFQEETIYARIHNINRNECFDITSFTIKVTDVPIPVQPSVYRLCDDTASGSDTDGITNNFRLSTKDAEVLGTLNPAQYNVTYHTSLVGAQTDNTTDVIDKYSDYTVTNSQRVYVRVENVDNVACNAVSNDAAGSTFMSFELIVDPLPVIDNNPAELIQCHNNPNLMTTVNLKLARQNISANYVTNMETFRYFPTQADAIAGSNEITGTDIETYPVTGTGEAWVRIISNQGCYRISQINITVNFSADLAYNKTYTVCDDFLDANGNDNANNDDTDGIATFNFSDSEAEIKAFFPIASQPDLDVFYYETEADRTASINDINAQIANHRNNGDPSFANNQTIYVKIVNNTNNGCSGTANIFLQVNSVPIANNPPTGFEFCDDNDSGSTIDGQNIGINLRDKVTDILGPTQNPADYIVSFHTSLADANDLTSTGIANDTNYTNVPQAGFNVGDVSMQTIFVRVQDRNANPACYNANDASFTITINPLPEISTTIDDLAICDVPNATDTDPRNRVAQNIDLTSKNAEILNGRTNHIVEYYTSAVNAQNRNPIANPSNYENDAALTAFPTNFNTDDPGIQTIFFRVIDQTGAMCESIFSTFNLSIYPEPNIPTNISDYTDCDNTSDSFGSDRNGINGDITLKNKIPEILANYPVSDFDDFKVTFYTSLAAAQLGNPADALNEDVYQNTANNETIFVRVENTKNTPVACIQTRLSFNINIQPLPIFTVMGEENVDDPQILCLNDTPLTLEAENAGAIYDYEWTDEAGATLGNNQTLDVASGGKYTVTATDRVSLCTRSRTIVVKESNPATLQESFLTIIDESNNIGSQDNISIYINNVDNDLGPGDYQFAIINNDDNTRIPSIGYQDESLFENLEGGIYTIIVNDKNGCAPDATLTTSVIQFPKFFTPNGDGDNDTWVVKGANKTFYPNSSINIFDRFGKLVGQVPIDSQGWNGTFNGKLLPSDDYWYNITLIPANTNKPTIFKKGNFSMLRK